MEIPSKYSPKNIESKWYDYWQKNHYFDSSPDEREPYTIVIPPPNVTGILHMGHMLNNTIQDVLIRRARLQGKNACWVPGTDHASIATEAKVVAKLKTEGITKASLTKDEFLNHAWEWTNKHEGLILKQLKKLGCSCDWSRTKFTLESSMCDSVTKIFIDLYNKGLIYRGYRMINWDPIAKTTLSDEEVNYVEKQGKLYYISYAIEKSQDAIVIATTRPETILGDTAICIHPKDERYAHLKGKRAIVPICNKLIPIIEDEYVDVEFGTGCLKVTPAHDENDKNLGDKHQLEVIDIFNEDATLNHFGLHYEGKDRFVVREEIAEELQLLGCLVKTENYNNKIGLSERTNAIIEPRLSDQWFLKMKKLAEPALKAILEEEINLFPKKFKNTYKHWMENIKDWNISRQLWWGHQIPVYYYGANKEDFVVASSREEALVLAQSKSENSALALEDLKQDPDSLDTWFSAWLWPISVFDGIRNPNNSEYNYYYPTHDLVTAPDILFFWVARMIIAGYEFKKTKPFTNVYLTGLVRDKKGRKMSKQLGNSPDALKLIEDFGADGVRVGLLLSTAAGNDLLFDESLCKQGTHFCNKIWNAFRLIKSWEVVDMPPPKVAIIGLAWYEAKFQEVLAEVEDHFSKYRISDALMAIYKLVWGDFCSWLLEIVKPAYAEAIDRKTYNIIIAIFENNLKLLHPFLPFLTEEIWQHITKRSVKEALIIAEWPKTKKVESGLVSAFEFASEVISGIRKVRKSKNIPKKEPLSLFVINKTKIDAKYNPVIKKLGNLSCFEEIETPMEEAVSYRVKSNEYYIPINGKLDIKSEMVKLKQELTYNEGFLNNIRKKLSNAQFINGAPKKVIATERKKETDTLLKIKTIKNRLEALN